MSNPIFWLELHLAALFKIRYKICTLLHRSKRKSYSQKRFCAIDLYIFGTFCLLSNMFTNKLKIHQTLQLFFENLTKICRNCKKQYICRTSVFSEIHRVCEFLQSFRFADHPVGGLILGKGKKADIRADFDFSCRIPILVCFHFVSKPLYNMLLFSRITYPRNPVRSLPLELLNVTELFEPSPSVSLQSCLLTSFNIALTLASKNSDDTDKSRTSQSSVPMP